MIDKPFRIYQRPLAYLNMQVLGPMSNYSKPRAATVLEDAAAELNRLFSPTTKCPDRLALDSSSYDDSSESSLDEDTVNSASSADLQISRKNATGYETYPNGSFPPSCLRLVSNLPGNNRCIDCDDPNPQWASISYGVVLCLYCSASHRSLGVSVSKVRSLAMDSWSHVEILAMLEGGNAQLSQFFRRHSLGPHDSENSSTATVLSKSSGTTRDDMVVTRYKTKAAKFYRENLEKHIERVKVNGEYKGREVSRKLKREARCELT